MNSKKLVYSPLEAVSRIRVGLIAEIAKGSLLYEYDDPLTTSLFQDFGEREQWYRGADACPATHL